MNPATKTDTPTRILIVEDSPTQAAELQFLLEGEGYAVSHARNGQEALASLERELPALVISDVVMPDLDGYEMCRRMKAHPSFRLVPVVLLTTLSEPGDIFKGLECSADYYAVKPYDGTALVSRVRAILADRYVSNTHQSRMGLEISYGGRKYFINADRIQILDLLLATFENIVRKNRELENAQPAAQRNPRCQPRPARAHTHLFVLQKDPRRPRVLEPPGGLHHSAHRRQTQPWDLPATASGVITRIFVEQLGLSSDAPATHGPADPSHAPPKPPRLDDGSGGQGRHGPFPGVLGGRRLGGANRSLHPPHAPSRLPAPRLSYKLSP